MQAFRFKILSLCLALMATYLPSANACTDFNLVAKDGSIVVARSMEFAIDLKSSLRSSPRGRVFKTTATDGKATITWTAKYGYMYLDGLGADITVDGVNEQGLSFGALYLPGLAEYQTAKAGQSKDVLPYYYIGDWILSNFANVEEVRAAVSQITVVAQKLPAPGSDATILPIHVILHDASGKSLVIEYVAGKLNIYDNKIGILTNCPEFPWHVTNLNNYLNLRPTNPNPVVIKGMTFVSTGQGGGMLGLPGDISPPSRFVKMSVFKAVVEPVPDALSAVNLAEHMINNVDIPFGLAREPQKNNYTNEYTQWTVFKDLTNKKFYYKTYYDPTLHVVDMKQVNFTANAPSLKMPIDAKSETIVDDTAKFLKG